MRQELFTPYCETLSRCIGSCDTPEQLICCHDLIDRFNERFSIMIEATKLSTATNLLVDQYTVRQAQLGIM